MSVLRSKMSSSPPHRLISLINAETRPWTYCIDLEEFGWFKSTQDKAKVPADKLFQYFEDRVLFNLLFFRSNYALLLAVFYAYCCVAKPLFLLMSVIMFGAYTYYLVGLSAKHRQYLQDNPTHFFVLVVASLFTLSVAGGSTLVVALLLGVLIVLVHALTHIGLSSEHGPATTRIRWADLIKPNVKLSHLASEGGTSSMYSIPDLEGGAGGAREQKHIYTPGGGDGNTSVHQRRTHVAHANESSGNVQQPGELDAHQAPLPVPVSFAEQAKDI